MSLSLLAALHTALAGGADFDKLLRLAAERYGPDARARVEQWERLALDHAAATELDQLEATNRFFNEKIAFADDLDVWNEKDYWATPLESLGLQRGDCEDFSVAKYATLLLLGVPMQKLRLIYVRASIGGPQSRVTQAHMVLAYYASPSAEPLILDNLVGEILPASRRPDLKPVFSFNSAGLWVGGSERPAAADPTARLSRWQHVLQRMHTEGLAHDPEESS